MTGVVVSGRRWWAKLVEGSRLGGGRRRRWFLAGLFVVALLCQVIWMRRRITYYDENLELYCAERVLHGQIPYRDFWTLYGPAQFYVLAGFFKVFGVTVLTGRLYDALVKAGIACLSYVLGERLAGKRAGLLAYAAGLLCLSCGVTAIYNFPVFPALLCGLGSMLLLSRFLEEPGRIAFLWWSGVLTGVTATFRHDSGFYVCVAVCGTLGWAAIGRRRGDGAKAGLGWGLGRALGVYLAGVVLVAGPVLGWLLWKVPLHDLYFDLIYMPGVVYPKVRNLPFPTLAALRLYLHPLGESTLYALEDWVVYLPVGTVATSLAVLVGTRGRRRLLWEQGWKRLTFDGLVLLDALLFVKGWVRATEVHAIQANVVAALLIVVMVARRRVLGRGLRAAVVGCGVLLAGYAGLLLWHAGTFVRWNVRDVVRPGYHNSIYNTCRPRAGLERARCLVMDGEAMEAIEYVQRMTAPGDAIYVGAGRHDRLLSNDVRFYFVAARPSMTKWYDLHPGVQTTLAIQNEMVEAMRLDPPKAIVLNDAWDEIEEPNASRFSSGVTVLDDYIRAHYVERATFGSYTILAPAE